MVPIFHKQQTCGDADPLCWGEHSQISSDHFPNCSFLISVSFCRWTVVVRRLQCGCLLRTALFRGPERSSSSRPVPRGSSSMEAPKIAAFSASQSRSGTVASSCCTSCSRHKAAWDTVRKVQSHDLFFNTLQTLFQNQYLKWITLFYMCWILWNHVQVRFHSINQKKK